MNVQVFPFQQIWSKSIIYCHLPISQLRATQFPLWIIHPPVLNTRHLFLVIFWCPRSSTWGSCDCFPSTSSLQPRSPSCAWGPDVVSEAAAKKSLRTNPTLNFQQRREKILQQWFNLMLFCSVSPRVIFHLNDSVIMWRAHADTHTHTDSLIVSCLLQSCFSHMFTL